MENIITPLIAKTVGLFRSTQAAIFPFTEEPGQERLINKSSNNSDKSIDAAELFSFFTADIIKEEVIFTR